MRNEDLTAEAMSDGANSRLEDTEDSGIDVASVASVARWIARQFAARLQVASSEIDIDRSFSGFGVDSIAVLELIEELEVALNCAVSPATLYEDPPTIRGLARRVVARCPSLLAEGPASHR